MEAGTERNRQMTQAGTFDETVIFLHVPKAAGSTLNRLIEWEYPLSEIYSVDPVFYKWSWEHLQHLSNERLKKTRVFKGHSHYSSSAGDLHHGAERAGRPRPFSLLLYARLQITPVVLETEVWKL